MRVFRNNRDAGFTLIEIMLSMVVIGFVLISVAGIFALYQKGSAKTRDYSEAQQNSRAALDCITDHLRQAGSQTDYFRGQRPIVHAGPYQVALNADIDNGRTIDGLAPLVAINPAVTPNTVPAGGSTIYAPSSMFDSDAETIVFSLDSNADGRINAGDQGDDIEEDGENRNLFVMKKYTYGFDGGRNEVRDANIAIVRGPNLAPTWTIPQPLFQYWYDHDDNPASDNRLWGDTDLSGELDDKEALAITDMPNNLLSQIRRIKVTAISESDRYDSNYETNGGYLDVTMTSEVYVRNSQIASSIVRGKVFHDADKDGIIDSGESGIPNVQVRLAGQNRDVITDNFGVFYFPLPAGTYSIQEVDPPGYASTTKNLVSVTLASGQSQVVNFGDIATTPYGVINGYVFEDEDKDGKKGLGEKGLPGVLISLDDGAQTLTDDMGYYAFTAMQGDYIVVETDPVGYSSTTTNSGSASIVDQDDTVTVHFGDFAGMTYGVLEGYVFLDENDDGVRNSMEEGLPNVTIKVSSGDSTLTNATGYYVFNLEPNTYEVTERDPMGYTSTTVNTYVNIVISADTTVVRNFGDVLEDRQDFVEIHISNTERVLSVTTANLEEDGNHDQDIILGTALSGGIGNMMVFHNEWENTTTPVYELFNSEPSYRRDAGYNVNAMARLDLSGDGVPDIVTGLDVGTERNIQVWMTEKEGVLGTSPTYSFVSDGSNEAMDLKLADLDGDGREDLVVGLKSPFGSTGGFEIFRGMGYGDFMPMQYIIEAGRETAVPLGEIWAVETGDIDGDGDEDIVVGSHNTPYYGYIDIYENLEQNTGKFAWIQRYQAWGAVNDLKVVDMMADDSGYKDIVAALTMSEGYGYVMLWLNEGGTLGVQDTTGYSFEPEVMPVMPDDWVYAEGEALSLAVLHINNDVFPDLAYGTRNSALYTGNIYVLPAYGTLPMYGDKINQTGSGEVVSIDVADFNKDNRPDIVVGTRSTATQGRLVAYFGRD
jgi:prepilin-type N-terminal cleavage/methylation domain-containing protein